MATEIDRSGVLDPAHLALDLFFAADQGDVGGTFGVLAIEHAAIGGLTL